MHTEKTTMTILKSLKDCAVADVVLCLGNFDGMHWGHQKVMAVLQEEAKIRHAQAVCVTFDPHPLTVLRPNTEPFLLTTQIQKMAILRRLGISLCCVIPFTTTLAQQSPEDFVVELINAGPRIRAVVVGFNFHFGSGRRGNTVMLRQQLAAAGIELIVVSPFAFGEEVVSSSAIRALLRQGQIAEVQECLGRPFQIQGQVVRGDGRGRTIGFPTANVQSDPYVLLPRGVYAARIFHGDQIALGVVNIGQRPTFDSNSKLQAEVHLLDWQGDLYGQNIAMDLLHKIRDEQKFSSMEELKAQIIKDCFAARKIALDQCRCQ